MRERDRLVIREHLAEVSAQEAAAKERIEAPIRAQTEQLKNNHAKLIAIQRENILRLKDENIFVSPELKGATMTMAEAAEFNLREANRFVAESPFYASYRTDSNSEILVSYFLRNGIKIFDAQMLRIAFVKLRDLGALEAKPAALEPTPEPISEPTPATKEPELFHGFDPDTDLPITLTKRQVDKLSADQYRRIFKVRNSDLDLSRYRGPGPVGQVV